MGKISKATAEEIATKMAKPKLEVALAIKEELSQLGYEVALKNIPLKIWDAFRYNPSYFRKTQYVQFHKNGHNGTQVYFPNKWEIPVLNGSTYTEASVEDSNNLLDLHHAYTAARKKYDQLVDDISIAILAIGTTTRLKTEFPQAAAYLPEGTKAVAINLTDILNRL